MQTPSETIASPPPGPALARQPAGHGGSGQTPAATPPEPEPGLIGALAQLPRPVWILFLGTFLNRFGTFVVPFLALYMTAKGFNAAQISVVIGAYGLGHFLASGVGGYLADRCGRRNTIVLSMACSAVVVIILGHSQHYYAIVVFAGLAGLSSELYRPAALALLTDLVPLRQRLTAFGAYRLSFNAGFALGPAVAGLVSEHSFRWIFIGDAATSALFGIIAWSALPQGLRSRQEHSSWIAALRVLRSDLRFLQFVAACGLMALVFFQIFSTYPIHITRLGFSKAVFGGLLSFNAVLIVLFELPLTRFTRRFPARGTIATGFLLAGGGLALNGLASGLPLLVVSMFLLTLGEMLSMPVSTAYIAHLAPEQLRGRYLGAYGLIWALGLATGPGIGMMLYNQRPALLWWGCALGGSLAALILVAPAFIRRRSDPAEHNAQCQDAGA